MMMNWLILSEPKALHEEAQARAVGSGNQHNLAARWASPASTAAEMKSLMMPDVNLRPAEPSPGSGENYKRTHNLPESDQ